MENLKTIKQYAAHAGVSVQSVYRRLQTEQNVRALEGHIIKDRGSTFLDEYAVQYLDGTRPAAIVGSPAAQQEQIVLELSDKAHKLQEENDALKEKLMDALQRLTAATQDAADSKIALADSQARLRLLEAQNEATGDLLQEHKEEVRKKAEEADQLRQDLDQAQKEALQLRQDLIGMDQLKADLREAENEVEGFRDRYQEAKQESAGLREDLRGADEEIRQLKTDLKEAEDKASGFLDKYRTAHRERVEYEKDLLDADEEIRRLQEDLQDAEADGAEARQACGELQADLDDAKAELARLKSRGFWARLFNR